MKSLDEREGKPSASALSRIIACPASFRENSLYPDNESKDAKEGTEKHYLMERSFKRFGMSIPQESLGDEACDRAVFRVQQMVVDTLSTYNVTPKDDDFDLIIEERLWDKNRMLSCKVDLCIIYKPLNVAFVFDYKFGYKEVKPATNNIQMHAQALIIYDNFKCENIFGSIIQENSLFSNEDNICKYDAGFLEKARVFLTRIIKSASMRNAKHKSGEHCTFCNARGLCEETAMQILKFNVDVAKGISITPQTAANVYDKCKLIETYCANLKAQITKKVFEAPDHYDCFSISNGNRTEYSTNNNELYRFIIENNILSSDEFVECCKVSIKSLKEKIKEKCPENLVSINRFIGINYSDKYIRRKYTNGKKTD